MRAAIVAGAVIAVAMVAARPAAADLPAGRVALAGGVKSGTGRLASTIGRGYAIGFEAGYAPMSRTQRIGIGGSWSTTWSYYRGGSARIADEMRILEMDVGARLRVALGAKKRQVMFFGGGAALIRSNEPLLDDGDRTEWGPWGGAGVEGRDPIFGVALMAMTVRYGLIRDGQGTLSVMISIGGGR